METLTGRDRPRRTSDRELNRAIGDQYADDRDLVAELRRHSELVPSLDEAADRILWGETPEWDIILQDIAAADTPSLESLENLIYEREISELRDTSLRDDGEDFLMQEERGRRGWNLGAVYDEPGMAIIQTEWEHSNA